MTDFKELGLSHYESKALENLLKEALDARALSKKANIPLGKVYSVLLSLEKKNLITKNNSRPNKYYVESASEVVNKLIEQKQKQHEDLLSNMRDLASQIDISRSKPSKFFDFGITNEDNKRLQLRSFQEAEKEVCQIINVYHKPESNRPNKSLWEKEIENAIERGVIFKSIYPEGVKLPTLLEKLSSNRFQVKRFNTDFARCDIIDRKKVLIKLVHKDAVANGGIIFIENEKFAKNLYNVFEEFWNNAK